MWSPSMLNSRGLTRDPQDTVITRALQEADLARGAAAAAEARQQGQECVDIMVATQAEVEAGEQADQEGRRSPSDRPPAGLIAVLCAELCIEPRSI